MMSEARLQHRKRKHKHRFLEKAGEDGFDLNLPSTKVKMPNDAFNFIKQESSSSSVILSSSPAISHGFSGSGERPLSSSVQNLKVVASGHGYPQAMIASKQFTKGILHIVTTVFVFLNRSCYC